jgi:hypothetical protein
VRLYCLLVGRPAPRPHRHKARADGAVKQRQPPAQRYNDSRNPTNIEALLDRTAGRATRAQPSTDPRKQHKRPFLLEAPTRPGRLPNRSARANNNRHPAGDPTPPTAASGRARHGRSVHRAGISPGLPSTSRQITAVSPDH